MRGRGYSSRLKKGIRLLLLGEPMVAGRDPIPVITQDEVEEVLRFFPLPKFFIFGYARSGTTLLARLVRLHRQVHCNWQAHFFTRPPFLSAFVESPTVAEWLSRRNNRWNRGRDLSPVVLRVVADFILEREAVRVGKGIVGDKSPSNLLHGEAVTRLAAVYPDAKLVYIMRDARDALVSHRLQSFVDAVSMLNQEDRRLREEFLSSPESFLGGGRSIFTPAGLRQGAENWAKNVTETVAAGRELFADRFLHLRFEDLLVDPLRSIEAVWAFLGAAETGDEEAEAVRAEMAQNPDAVWQRSQWGDIASRIPKGGAGSWRTVMTIQDLAVVEQVAGPSLLAWGYGAGAGP